MLPLLKDGQELFAEKLAILRDSLQILIQQIILKHNIQPNKTNHLSVSLSIYSSILLIKRIAMP